MKINRLLIACLASILSACYAEPPPAISGGVLGNTINEGKKIPPSRTEIPDPPFGGIPLKVVDYTAFIDTSLPARFSETGGRTVDYYSRLNTVLDSRNPELDAKAAIQNGEKFFLVYTENNPSLPPSRKASLIVTGDPPNIPIGSLKINCDLKYIQGMESSVDHENKETWSIFNKLSQYGNKWNNVMNTVCHSVP